MSKLRTILLIGRDPYQLRSALQESGFTASAGFQIVEAGGVNAAAAELKSDDSIVAVATADVALHDGVRDLAATRKGLALAMVNNIDGMHMVPKMLARDLNLTAG